MIWTTARQLALQVLHEAEAERLRTADKEAMTTMTDLKWTTERPTQPGFYFYRADESDDPTVCQLTDINKGRDWYVHWLGLSDGGYLCDLHGDQWSGPLPVPEEPRKEG